jgi:hypothetical protein
MPLHIHRPASLHNDAVPSLLHNHELMWRKRGVSPQQQECIIHPRVTARSIQVSPKQSDFAPLLPLVPVVSSTYLALLKSQKKFPLLRGNGDHPSNKCKWRVPATLQKRLPIPVLPVTPSQTLLFTDNVNLTLDNMETSQSHLCPGRAFGPALFNACYQTKKLTSMFCLLNR